MDFSDITTIIFDMDGTLIKHTWRLSQVSDALFARFAEDLSPVSQDEFFSLYWPKNEDMWHMMVAGVLSGDTAATYGYVNTLRALGQDTSLAEPMLNYWRELVLDEAIPFEDTFTVLNALHGKYTIGILTNGFTTLQRGKMKRHKLAEIVDFTLVSQEAGYHKPDRRAFLKALQMAGQPCPERTLFVGDSLDADIRGAQNAGIMPILMNPSNDLEPPHGVIKIRELSELLVLLKLKD